MKQGIVKWFNAQKGYGFITGNDGVDYFVHYSSIEAEGYKTLTEGQAVAFDVEQKEKGPEAKHVHLEANAC